MVVRVITGLRTALEMPRVARVRVVGERCSGTPKRHGQRQHERRDQQRNALLHLLSPPFAHSRQHHRPKERRMEGRGTWALRPRLTAGLPLSRRRSARAHVMDHTNSEEGDIYAAWPFISGASRADRMPGGYSLHTNFRERGKGELLIAVFISTEPRLHSRSG